VANKPNLFRIGAVGFIDLLDLSLPFVNKRIKLLFTLLQLTALIIYVFAK
jgi:hypothetical protein